MADRNAKQAQDRKTEGLLWYSQTEKPFQAEGSTTDKKIKPGLNLVAGKVCTTAGDELQQDRRAKFLLECRIWCERSLMGLNEMPYNTLFFLKNQQHDSFQ